MGIRLPWATGAAVALVLWIVLGVRGLAPVRAGTPDELKARFLKEAPTAWEEYQAYLQGLQGTLVSTGTLADGKLHGATRYEFRNNGNAKLRLVQCLGPEYWEGEVVAFNPVYGFTLKRRSPDAGWALSDLEMGEKGYNRKLWATGLLLPLTWSISPAGDNLAALVRKPTFRVIRASALRRGGIELVHIDFENRHPHAATPLDPTQGGSFLVDPERSWILHAFTLRQQTYQGHSSVKGQIQLRDSTANRPIPKRTVYVFDWTQLKEVNAVLTVTTEYELTEASSAPGDEAFTLSAFDLPEPQGVVWHRPSRWYLWFIGGGVACLAAAGYFWRRSQRRKVASVQTTAQPSAS